MTLIPDYTSSCLIDDFEGPIDLKELGLSKELIEKINSWHSSYKRIIPMSGNERTENYKKIEELDLFGIEIVKELQKIFPQSKIRYYSEGKLKYINSL